MNAKFAFRYDVYDFLESELTSVTGFQTASRHKSSETNDKDEGIENGPVLAVEGTIDEHIAVEIHSASIHPSDPSP
jgi:hypothetical protein